MCVGAAKIRAKKFSGQNGVEPAKVFFSLSLRRRRQITIDGHAKKVFGVCASWRTKVSTRDDFRVYTCVYVWPVREKSLSLIGKLLNYNWSVSTLTAVALYKRLFISPSISSHQKLKPPISAPKCMWKHTHVRLTLRQSESVAIFPARFQSPVG